MKIEKGFELIEIGIVGLIVVTIVAIVFIAWIDFNGYKNFNSRFGTNITDKEWQNNRFYAYNKAIIELKSRGDTDKAMEIEGLKEEYIKEKNTTYIPIVIPMAVGR